MKLIKIPKTLADYWYSVKDQFSYGHYHIFCWLIIAHCIHPGKANLAVLVRWLPEKILYKHLIRLLQSDRWNFTRIFQWHCRQIWKVIPQPEDGILYLIVDKTIVEKTGKKHPYNKKDRNSNMGPWLYGFGLIILMAHWGPYRFPVDFRLVLPKKDDEYQNPNELFREMFDQFVPPKWAKQVTVLADCGFASKDNIKAIMSKEEDAYFTGIHYYYTFSFARTWKFEGEFTASGKPRNIKDFVNHLPRCRYKKMWFKDINGRRKTYETVA